MRYPGGKGGSFRHIINLMPPHRVYIETHLGGGNVLLKKRPASTNIGIDADGSVIARWSDVRSRLPYSLTLHNTDAAAFLRSYNFKGGELVYCDPPYMPETRRRLNLYKHEYTHAQHVELLDVLVLLPCFVIISGYPSSLYAEVLQHRHGWRCLSYNTTTRRGSRLECAWFNFDPVAKHDCRYTGDNYRERERIRRKRDRWLAKFAQMDPAEREVVLGALLEILPPKAAMEACGTLPPEPAMSPANRHAPADTAGTDGARSPSLVAMS